MITANDILDLVDEKDKEKVDRDEKDKKVVNSYSVDREE
jgi:hypothetical protein